MKTILSVMGTAVIVIILALAYYGLFTKVEIVEREVGGFWLIYEKHVGDYRETGQIIDRVYSALLGEDAIEPSRGFGLYYDDPKKVEKENLRSIAGCILDRQDESKIEQLKTHYNAVKYPASRSVVAEFPYRGTLSIFMGIFKVYPKLGEYMEQHSYTQVPIMEIYDTPGKKISYIASITMGAEVFDEFLE